MYHTLIITLATTAAASTAASAGVSPFTETFADNNANWTNAATDPLGWSAAGGADGGGYVSSVFNFGDSSPGGFPQVLFRGQDDLNSSGGAFVGDWIAAGITELSFAVRHNAPVDLEYFIRLAPAGANSPSVNLIFAAPVQSGEWTQLTVDISPDNPDFVYGGGGDVFTTVFSNMGKIQIGITPDPLIGIDENFTFDLDLVTTSVPAPGVLAVLGIAGCMRSRRRR